MQTIKTSGYLMGYMYKQADATTSALLNAGGAVTSGAADLALSGADRLRDWAMAVPPVLGAGAGYLHSRITSPSEMDLEAARAELLESEYQELAAEMARQKKLRAMRAKRGAVNERGIRI